MPEILSRQNLPGCQSAAVRFFTGSGNEEIHLFYSLGREHGPGIIRDGRGPARMARIYPPYGYTEDPVEQRVGTWFIDQDLRNKANSKFNALPKEAQDILARNQDYISYSEFDASLRSCNAQSSSARKLIGLQSFGDLTMNLWNVAFVRLPNGDPRLIYLNDEPINDRVYSCVVKWKPGNKLGKRAVTIDFLRFSSFLYDANPNDPQVVRLNSSGDNIADQIEFAASGKLLIRDRRVVEAQEIVDQFTDIRHLVALANLNPQGSLYLDNKTPTPTPLPSDSGKPPRFYFGKQQEFDLWFGEAALLQYRNTRRAAVNGVIELNRLESGASEEQVRAALSFQKQDSGINCLYQEVTDPVKPLRRGEWRFVAGDNGWIDIWLKPNIYPSNILGVTESGDVICFSWQGSYTEAPGHTLIEDLEPGDDLKLYGEKIFSATTMLKMAGDHLGLTDAILLDEGSDVRLDAFDDTAKAWQQLVGKQREQVRAMILYTI